MELTDELKNKIDEFFDNKTEAELQYIADKYHTLQLQQTGVISRLKLNLDIWIDSCEKASGNLNDMGHYKESKSLEGQATAYWAVKTFLDVNGL